MHFALSFQRKQRKSEYELKITRSGLQIAGEQGDPRRLWRYRASDLRLMGRSIASDQGAYRQQAMCGSYSLLLRPSL
jgi:hypothetical protein